jgi:DNA-binding NarL/FixJ family response regulator
VRLVVDTQVARVKPELTSGAVVPGATVQVFNPHDNSNKLASDFAQLKPEVLVVDPQRFVLSSLLTKLLSLTGNNNSRLVLGCQGIDDVTKIKAAHHGYFDVLNLVDPAEVLADNLRRIHQGKSSLENDALWKRIPKPPSIGDVSTVAQDDTDYAILELVCVGLRDQDIAEVLGYSIQAIKNRISLMLARAGSPNRTQIASQFTNQLLVAEMIAEIAARKSDPNIR